MATKGFEPLLVLRGPRLGFQGNAELLEKQRVEWWLAKEGRAEPDSGA